jgi:hypothetical protein
MAVWTTAVKTWAAGNRLTGVLLNAQLRDFANAFGPRGSYSPALTASGTAFAIGNGSVTGVYSQVQNEVRGNATINIGTTTNVGTGVYALTLPVAASNYQLGRPIGQLVILISGTISHVRTAVLISSTQIGFVDTGGTRVGPGPSGPPSTAGVPANVTSAWYGVVEFAYEAA